MSTSTITSKGQTTIPKEIREQLGLSPGDRVEYVVEPDGRVVLLPATRHVNELRGILKHRAPARPVTLEEMDEAIRKGAAE
ncbi:MAG: AbrB/MazE/SpoVT family DNA-binding domain-containing protein [Gammaproteobacteria bacterium]|nr:AbrB/MazE/SpoVT family DNA-binding domain-containing protein [Gammaproteobacteria bacterium]NIR85861.1 AbrB/MazE/SpoVT family DNA-binding domain-containing protein [Gammaproteobacteria bacterium]NIR90624.1 AbrB/MazE/SpoVT family DNA-binding domain-containing protein [Gammaproteobacteria bacterium]NIU06996.1 AbrB/MazE/SpoVT family DNA-binding domain-containing protein [Gammaproteobacteria bacterium]NIV53911.1 AbrB/MazE/SpoVT family DNA-binding domain-containing protein [Gammaproteobacteria ba